MHMYGAHESSDTLLKLRDKRDIVLYPCISKETSHLYMQHAWRPTYRWVADLSRSQPQGEVAYNSLNKSVVDSDYFFLTAALTIYEDHPDETCPGTKFPSISK